MHCILSNYQYQYIQKNDRDERTIISFSNASTVINDLLKNYDSRLRPNFGGKLFFLLSEFYYN